ncbi:MAG: CDP-alcohol phosphatidyltransferase family protein [Proteobacteria bacterium]|nr:CDP-alcohol phosphatidyltransferase family protein [Pseudomonadota bacterium]
MTDKPWDARLSAWLVRPLVNTSVHPNVLTTLRLGVGLWGAILFASGTAFNLGALFIVLSNFLDHTDGELARMSGKTSRFGHRYDLLSDAVVTVGLFVGLGLGLQDTVGSQAITFGAIAGVAVAGIFQLRHAIEQRHGKLAVKQASAVGFETEDVLYLLPLVTLSDQQSAFLYAAAIGAPVALVIVVVQFLRQPNTTNSPS